MNASQHTEAITCTCKCRTYECVVMHKWISHVAHINESCYMYEWVISHVWMRRVARINASRHTYECVTSHVWTSHVARTNALRRTCAWVTSHMSMRDSVKECVRVCARVRMCLCCSAALNVWCTTCVWMRHVALLNTWQCRRVCMYVTESVSLGRFDLKIGSAHTYTRAHLSIRLCFLAHTCDKTISLI